jgi:hypothetical protein
MLLPPPCLVMLMREKFHFVEQESQFSQPVGGIAAISATLD